ncbi:MAG TPA: conjugal transfer protein TraF [Vicinamibacterales bacterium]|nr:conjugal transfer protein TraF [Vicinamibacterales bacterium]
MRFTLGCGTVAGVTRILTAGVVLLSAGPAFGQGFEAIGTRAAGMGGAFVAVADDASAVYWNPAGLALGGSYFSLVLDGGTSEADPDDVARAGRHSNGIIALSTLPLGLSYYRLTSAYVAATPTLASAPPSSVEHLATHHIGLTFVQSVISGIAVATTVKAVRGYAGNGVYLGGETDALLDAADNLPDRGTTRFDADIGVLTSYRSIRAGVTIRNVTEPDFSTPADVDVELKRQTRAGIAYVGLSGVILAGDIDIERTRGSLGERRNLAAGAEARVVRRVTVRSGFRFNTLSDEPGGHAPVAAFGASVATFKSLLVDGQMTVGSKYGDRGWGIAARLVY